MVPYWCRASFCWLCFRHISECVPGEEAVHIAPKTRNRFGLAFPYIFLVESSSG